jgi:hypothetical protein
MSDNELPFYAPKRPPAPLKNLDRELRKLDR